MCLAVPMKLTSITGPGKGVSVLEGAQYEVDLSLVPDVQVGEYLIVHAGFAIEKLDQAEADERLKLFAGMAEMYAEQDNAK